MLSKDKLSTIESLISKHLIDSCISNFSMNNVLQEYDVMKQSKKKSKTFDSDNKYGWYYKTNIDLRKMVHWYKL